MQRSGRSNAPGPLTPHTGCFLEPASNRISLYQNCIKPHPF